MSKLNIVNGYLLSNEELEDLYKFSDEYTKYLDSLPDSIFTDNNTLDFVSLMDRDVTDEYGNDYLLNEQYLLQEANKAKKTKKVAAVSNIIDHINYMYGIPKELFLTNIKNHIENIHYKILPSYWKCPVSLAIPKIRGNLGIIKMELEQFGYYMIASKDRKDKKNGKWIEILFNPIHQDSIRQMLNDKNKIIYHLSPDYNDESIQEFGIVPHDGQHIFKYKHQSFFFTDEAFDNQKFKDMVKGLNNWRREKYPVWSGENNLYSIRVIRLPEDIDFFWDPNMIYGIYTNKTIEPKYILETFYNYKI